MHNHTQGSLDWYTPSSQWILERVLLYWETFLWDLKLCSEYTRLWGFKLGNWFGVDDVQCTTIPIAVCYVILPPRNVFQKDPSCIKKLSSFEECILKRVMLYWRTFLWEARLWGFQTTKIRNCLHAVHIHTHSGLKWYGSSAYFTNIFFRDLSFSITKPCFELGM